MKLHEVKPKPVFPGFGSSTGLALKRNHTKNELLASAKKQFKDREWVHVPKPGLGITRIQPFFSDKITSR